MKPLSLCTAYAIAFVLFAVMAAYTLRFHYAIPMYEHLFLVDLLEKWQRGEYRFAEANQLYGGHWYLLGINLEVLLGVLTRWNLAAEAFVIILLVAAGYGLWCYIVSAFSRVNQAAARHDAWLLILGAFILFSLNQSADLLWTFQIAMFLHNVGVLACAASLASRRYGLSHFILALAAMLLAVYDYATGLALLPLYFFAMLLHPAAKRYALAWAAVACLVGTHYTFALSQATQAVGKKVMTLTASWETVQFLFGFTLRYIASPVLRAMTDIAPAAGFLAVCFCLYSNGVVFLRRRDRRYTALLPALLLVDFVVAAAFITASGRAEFGVDQAYVARYLLIGNLFWLGAALMAAGLLRMNAFGAATAKFSVAFRIGAMAMLACMLLLSVQLGKKNAKQSVAIAQTAARMRAEWSPDENTRAQRLALVNGNAEIMNGFDRMYREKLGIFRESEKQ